MSNKVLDFFIPGAAKAGTTSLYNYLAQHPQIFLPEQKEPKYFALKDHDLSFNGPRRALKQLRESTITEFADYSRLFDEAGDSQIIGDGSPMYLHNREASRNIFHLVPQAKFIVLLRNPMDRAYSDWRHNFHFGYEHIGDFREAVLAWRHRQQRNWIPYADYLDKGRYAQHLLHYLDLFELEQFSIHLYEDFAANPINILRKTFRFLEIADTTEIDVSRKYMRSKPISKYRRAHKLACVSSNVLNRFGAKSAASLVSKAIRKLEIAPTISTRDYLWLLDFYRADIRALENLLQRPLTGWFDEKLRKVDLQPQTPNSRMADGRVT